VDDFWRFAVQYWWLIFPVLGAFGGIGKAWERNARSRHQRRLEILRAKAEISSARAASRHQPGAAAASPAPAAPSHAEQLGELLAAHDAVTKRWLEYELDVAKLITFPTMSDGREPLTAAFLRAKKVADRLRPPSATSRVSDEQVNQYRDAVNDFEVAFDIAEREARRVRDSGFSEAERKRLDTAKQLLTVAVDQAATPAERQVAYRRVRDELEGLIAVSDEAIEVLEKKVALELPASPTSITPPAPEPGA
jgi:hypothetical protein